jgi:hypothetical protein
MQFDEWVQFQIPLKRSLRHRLKIVAAQNYTTLKDFTVDLIERGLREEEAALQQRSSDRLRRSTDDLVDYPGGAFD